MPCSSTLSFLFSLFHSRILLSSRRVQHGAAKARGGPSASHLRHGRCYGDCHRAVRERRGCCVFVLCSLSLSLLRFSSSLACSCLASPSRLLRSLSFALLVDHAWLFLGTSSRTRLARFSPAPPTAFVSPSCQYTAIARSVASAEIAEMSATPSGCAEAEKCAEGAVGPQDSRRDLSLLDTFFTVPHSPSVAFALPAFATAPSSACIVVGIA